MYKDPTEFRLRFAAWKDRKYPYKGGRPSAISEVDKSDADFAKRLRSNWRLEIWDWEGSGKAVTHKMGGFDNIVYPNVQTTEGGGLIDFTNPIWKGVVDPRQRAMQNKDFVPMKTESDAIWFGPNYKKYYPGFKNGKSEWDDSTDFITKYEGFSDTTYQKKGDVPTIGYGTTNKKWTSKGKITVALARLAMAEDLAANEGLLRKNIVDYDKLPDSAKTVLRDILYNVGSGNLFSKSPKFMKALNARNYEEAARQMDWDNNKPGFGGARKRNAARQELFLKDLRAVKPVSLFVSSLEERPLFEPVPIEVPVDRTDFSLLNASMQSPAPQSINAWKGKGSPAYGGYSSRIPSLQEYMLTGNIMPRGFKNGM